MIPLYSPQRAELYYLEHIEHLREGLHEGKSFRRMEVLFSVFLGPVLSVRDYTSGVGARGLHSEEALNQGVRARVMAAGSGISGYAGLAFSLLPSGI